MNTSIVAYLLFLLVGGTLGLLGGGGGILIVPLLVGLFRMDGVTATGTSLGLLSIGALVGSVPAIYLKQVEWKVVGMLGLPAIAGAFLARGWLIQLIPQKVFGMSKSDFLVACFVLLILFVAYNMGKPRAALARSGTGWDARQSSKVLSIGLGVGLLGGLLGAGGGFLLVPVLTAILGIEFRRSVSTSLVVISLQSLAGFIPFATTIDRFSEFAVWASFLSFGVIVGLVLRSYFKAELLQNSFRILLLLVALGMFVNFMDHF
jgi:uncharacterized membrane protein YfcA